MPKVREPGDTKVSEKGGRPGKITTDHLSLIEQKASEGMPLRLIAGLIGISEQKFHDYAREPENPVALALQRGQSVAAEKATNSLFGKVLAGDVQAIRWWEQSRLHIGINMNVSHSGGDKAIQINHTVANITPEQIKAAAHRLLELEDDPEIVEAEFETNEG